MVKQLLTRISFIGLTSILLITPFSTKEAQAKFKDVTLNAGVGKVGPSYDNPLWGDFNNDGYLDLFVPRHRATPSLYQNNGDGKFSDILPLSGITPLDKIDRHGWALGDYDRDGNLDISITNGGCRGNCLGVKKDELWKGDGQGTFVNVTDIAGVENTLGRGRASFWVDYNNDGRLDLFVLNTNTNSILYRNNGNGTFTDATWVAGLSNISGANCSWADYNNDNATDLLVTSNNKVRLFRNSPTTHTFIEATAQAGLLQVTEGGSGIAWGDYNNDGYLDLHISRGNDFIKNSLKWDPTEILFGDEEDWEDGIDFTMTGNQVTFDLYINNRNNRYQRYMVFLGGEKTNPLSIPFTVSVADPSLVGIPTYVAGTDMGFFIWRDDSGIWHLRYSGTDSGTDDWPTYYGILTSDGSFTTVTPTFNPVNFKRKDTLYRNNGNWTFTDVTDSAGVGKKGNHHASVWGDYDNDGYLDLYVVENGDVSGGRPNILYKNRGDGTFFDVAANQGVDASTVPGRHYGAAWGDYNNDGFLDLFMKNSLTRQYPRAMGSDILYRNNGNSNHWLKINLIGTIRNRLGIGTKLILVIDGKIQYREMNGGGGGELRSQGSGPIHFGIGPATIINSLIIRWPSGLSQTLTNIPADQTLTVVEGG